MTVVKAAHIGTPHRLHELRQAVCLPGREQQVQLIGQQGECVQLHAKAPCHLGQYGLHMGVILPIYKNGLQIVATQHHIVRQAGQGQAG